MHQPEMRGMSFSRLLLRSSSWTPFVVVKARTPSAIVARAFEWRDTVSSSVEAAKLFSPICRCGRRLIN